MLTRTSQRIFNTMRYTGIIFYYILLSLHSQFQRVMIRYILGRIKNKDNTKWIDTCLSFLFYVSVSISIQLVSNPILCCYFFNQSVFVVIFISLCASKYGVKIHTCYFYIHRIVIRELHNIQIRCSCESHFWLALFFDGWLYLWLFLHLVGFTFGCFIFCWLASLLAGFIFLLAGFIFCWLALLLV